MFNNNWSHIHDFTPVQNERNYSLLPVVSDCFRDVHPLWLCGSCLGTVWMWYLLDTHTHTQLAVSSMPSLYTNTCTFTDLHCRISSMNYVKWRMSRLVSDSALPRLYHWSLAALDYPLLETEPFRLPLIVSGTIYPSMSLLQLRCLSSGHASRLISSPFPIPVSDHVQCLHSDSCHFGHFNCSYYLLTYYFPCKPGLASSPSILILHWSGVPIMIIPLAQSKSLYISLT